MITISTKQLPKPLAEGGEGLIYPYGKDKVIKLFKDPKTIQIKQKKIEYLMSRPLPHSVIAPIDLVYDEKNTFIGYVMERAKGEEMKRLSNKKFAKQQGYNYLNILPLLVTISKTLETLHQQNIVIGDMNDGNILFHQNNVYFIDVDSWHLPVADCTVAMDSFKDPLLKGTHFTKQTDYFSFSILVFKTLTRLHPFSGTMEPSYNIIERMTRKLPAICVPGITIPKIVENWNGFPPSFIEKLKQMWTTSERFSLLDELEFFARNLTFCPNHKNAYYKRYSECPVCVDKATLIKKPSELEKTNDVPIVTLHKEPQAILHLTEWLYLDKTRGFVHTKTNHTFPFVEDFQFAYSDAANLYSAYENQDTLLLRINEKEITFSKHHKSSVCYEDSSAYFMTPNAKLMKLSISTHGIQQQTIATLSYRTFYNVYSSNHYALVNEYDSVFIFNINGYHDKRKVDHVITHQAFHYDEKTNHWLWLSEDEKGLCHALVFQNNTVVFEDVLRFHGDISHACFYNNTIYSPHDGFIRAFHVTKNHYKDFSVPIVDSASHLTRKKNHFLVLNDDAVYKVG